MSGPTFRPVRCALGIWLLALQPVKPALFMLQRPATPLVPTAGTMLAAQNRISPNAFALL